MAAIAPQYESKYRQSVRSITGGIEFLFDHLNESLGQIVIKAAPLISSAPSAVAIYFALLPHFGMLAALVLMVTVEGLGFAGVYTRDKIESKLNLPLDVDPRQVPPQLRKARRVVTGYFLAAMTTVFAFESLPAIIQFYNGLLPADQLALHIAPLVYPWLSNIGASVYSLLDHVRTDEQGAARTLDEYQSRVNQLSIDLELTRERVSELTVENAQLTGKLSAMSAARRPAQSEKRAKRLSKPERQAIIKRMVSESGKVSIAELVDTLGVTRNTVKNDARGAGGLVIAGGVVSQSSM